MSEGAFEVTLSRRTGYEFTVRLDDGQQLSVDVAPPLGRGHGPDPERLLATSVGHCLSSSLVHCVRRAGIDLVDLHTSVVGWTVRDERGRLRIGGLEVQIEPVVAEVDFARLGRCLDVFEDYCTVTGSVRKAFPVDVSVTPRAAPPVPVAGSGSAR